MQYITVATALAGAAAAATAGIDGAFVPGNVKVVNRCDYDVYLWSIEKQMGCPEDAGTKLSANGGQWGDKISTGADRGMAIKLSKSETCGGKDITQLEYFVDMSQTYGGNYLDMSFVDCLENLEDCPGRTDGFYLRSGSQTGEFKSASNNEHCPVFNVYNAEEAAKVSYILWDDRQTKFCDATQDLELYLCGGDAPDADDQTSEPVSSAAPSSSYSQVESAPSPTSEPSLPSESSESEPAPSSASEDDSVVAAAAAVTPAPAAPAAPAVKTEVVYVTEYVNKRHAHGRRHQHFHA